MRHALYFATVFTVLVSGGWLVAHAANAQARFVQSDDQRIDALMQGSFVERRPGGAPAAERMVTGALADARHARWTALKARIDDDTLARIKRERGHPLAFWSRAAVLENARIVGSTPLWGAYFLVETEEGHTRYEWLLEDTKKGLRIVELLEGVGSVNMEVLDEVKAPHRARMQAMHDVVASAVNARFKAPAGTRRSAGMSTGFQVTVDGTGRIVKRTMVASSGDTAFDRAAERAIDVAKPGRIASLRSDETEDLVIAVGAF